MECRPDRGGDEPAQAISKVFISSQLLRDLDFPGGPVQLVPDLGEGKSLAAKIVHTNPDSDRLDRGVQQEAMGRGAFPAGPSESKARLNRILSLELRFLIQAGKQQAPPVTGNGILIVAWGHWRSCIFFIF